MPLETLTPQKTTETLPHKKSLTEPKPVLPKETAHEQTRDLSTPLGILHEAAQKSEPATAEQIEEITADDMARLFTTPDAPEKLGLAPEQAATMRKRLSPSEAPHQLRESIKQRLKMMLAPAVVAGTLKALGENGLKIMLNQSGEHLYGTIGAAMAGILTGTSMELYKKYKETQTEGVLETATRELGDTSDRTRQAALLAKASAMIHEAHARGIPQEAIDEFTRSCRSARTLLQADLQHDKLANLDKKNLILELLRISHESSTAIPKDARPEAKQFLKTLDVKSSKPFTRRQAFEAIAIGAATSSVAAIAGIALQKFISPHLSSGEGTGVEEILPESKLMETALSESFTKLGEEIAGVRMLKHGVEGTIQAILKRL